MNLQERQEAYFRAFTNIFTNYQECQVSSGMQSYNRFYRRLAGEQSDSRGGMCVGTGLSDFIADVDLAIKEVLKQDYYANDFLNLSDLQKERIGKQFMLRKIYPVFVYFRAKRINVKR
jgi:hypothetical protein